MSDERSILICARADAALTIPGSDFSRLCENCTRRVQVAPSAKRLNLHVSCRIICVSCVRPEDGEKVATSVPIEAIRAEVMRAQPNMWRLRN